MRLCLLALLAMGLAHPVCAQETDVGWVEQKCATYAAAWTQALDLFGSDRMNYAFIAGNENFIASGCRPVGDFCPRSDQELDIANALTLALMNAGTASTFLPFRCEPAQPVSNGWSGPGL